MGLKTRIYINMSREQSALNFEMTDGLAGWLEIFLCTFELTTGGIALVLEMGEENMKTDYRMWNKPDFSTTDKE